MRNTTRAAIFIACLVLVMFGLAAKYNWNYENVITSRGPWVEGYIFALSAANEDADAYDTLGWPFDLYSGNCPPDDSAGYSVDRGQDWICIENVGAVGDSGADSIIFYFDAMNAYDTLGTYRYAIADSGKIYLKPGIKLDDTDSFIIWRQDSIADTLKLYGYTDG